MIKRSNRILIWLLVSFISFPTNFAIGQEMLGVTLGNYNALTGSLLNPAILTNTNNYLEINFLSADVFVNNNAAYIPASDLKLWDLWNANTVYPEYGEKKNNFLLYSDNGVKSAVANIRMLGPSAMFQYGKHAFALTSGVRVITTGNRLPNEMVELGYNTIKYKPLHNVNYKDYNIDFSTMQWMEVGLSYAYDVYHFLDDQVTIGATVRKLWGYSGAYATVDNADYIVLNDSTINVKNLNGSAGFAVPVDYYNNDFPMNNPLFKGSGLGFDVGVIYTNRRYIDDKRWERLCEQRYEEYNYRIGLSIIDIGRVKFKNNAQLHTFTDASLMWQNFDTIKYDNVNQVVSEISNAFYGSPDATYSGSSMKIGLPTAVSLQFDYRVKRLENVFIAAVWVHPLRFNKNTLRRPALLSVVPRYELKNLEFQLPLVLYEYRYPRVGFSARFSFLTIGTERLGTYLGLADLNGLDIYFSIKLNIGKGGCKNIRAPIECLNDEYGYSKKTKAKFKKRRHKRY